MIIGLSGFMGSGKDTVADMLTKRGGTKIALADPIKRICREVFDFSIESLWGPSEKRNEPDKRYLRMKQGALGYTDVRALFEMVNGKPKFSNILYPQYVGFEDVLTYYGDPGNFGYLPNPPRDEYLTPRHALQQLGTEWGRSCHSDIWVVKAVRIANKLLKEGSDPLYKNTLISTHPYCYEASEGVFQWDDAVEHGQLSSNKLPTYTKHEFVVISDVRFKNEINHIRSAGGKVFRVIRGASAKLDSHPSEAEMRLLEDADFDGVIFNSGSLEALEDTISRFRLSY